MDPGTIFVKIYGPLVIGGFGVLVVMTMRHCKHAYEAPARVLTGVACLAIGFALAYLS